MDDEIASLFSRVRETPCKLLFDKSDPKILKDNSMLSSATFSFKENVIFENGLIFTSMFPKIDYKTIKFDDLNAIFDSLMENSKTEAKNYEFLNSFCNKIIVVKGPEFFDLASIYLCFCLTLSFNEISNAFPIFLDNLLAPEYCVLNQSTKLKKQQLFSLRALSLELLLKRKMDVFIERMKIWVLQPEIFQEICYILVEIITAHQDEFVKKKFIALFPSIMKTLFYETTASNDFLVEERKSFLFLLSEMWKIESIANKLIESRPFVAILLSLLSDESMRSFLFQLLRGKLTQKIVSEEMEQIIKQVVDISDEVGKISYKLLADCLKAINFELNPTVYQSLCPCLKKIMKNWEQSNESIEFLYRCVDFYIRISVAPDVIMSLTVPFKRIKNDDCLISNDEKSIKSLVNLLFGHKLDQLDHHFPIEHPHALHVLYLVFADSKVFDVMDFCNKLCDFSIYNVCKLRESEFDVLLLEEVNRMKDDESCEKKIVEMLKIVSKIAVIVSSPTVVQSFINVLTPTDGLRHMSRTHPLILKTLADIFHSISISPPSFINMSQVVNERIVSSEKFDFSSGLIFSCWCHVISNVPSILLRLQHGEEISNVIKILLTKDGIKVNETIVGKLFSPLTWSFIVVAIDFSGSVSIYIDGSVAAKKIEFSGSNELDKLFIGGTINSANKIGNLSIRPLDKSINVGEIYKAIYLKGPKCIVEDSFSANFAEKNQMQNFSDVFFDVFGVAILVPLFAHIDLKTSDNKSLVVLPDIFKTLSAALLVNEEGQKSFANENGFIIIRHLLFYADQSNITFQLYNMFYDLFDRLTYMDLKKQLLESILLNFRLFSRASVKDQEMIIGHIANFLFPMHQSIFIESTTFSYILYNLETYYSYNVSDASGGEKWKNRQIEIKVHRDALFSLCSSFAKHKFTQDDFEFLMNCFAVSNDLNKYEVSKLILNVIPFVNKENSARILDRLLKLQFLQNFDDKTMINYIKIIINLHKICSFDIKLEDQLAVLSRGIFTRDRGEVFLDGLSEMINEGEAELFPLFSTTLMKLKNMKLIYKVKPTDKLVTSKSWCLNAVIFGVNFHNVNEENHVFKFLAECYAAEWKNIYDIIECNCVINQMQSSVYKTAFLIEAAKLVLDKEYQIQEVSKLLLLFEDEIFFRKVPYVNETIDKVYKNSLFYDKEAAQSEETFEWFKKVNDLSWTVFGGDFPEFDNFIGCELIDTKKSMFAIKITPENEWVHLELAETFVKVLLKYRIEQFYSFAFLINGFLVAKDFDFATYQLQQMNLTDSQKVAYSSFLDFTRFMIAKCKPQVQNMSVTVNLFSSTTKFIEGVANNIVKQRQQSSSYVELHEAIKAENFASIENCKFIFGHMFDCNKLYEKSCNAFAEEDRNLSGKGENEWTRLWCNASTFGTPWYFKNGEAINWKRSGVLCGNFCPMKMKKNKRFNDYKKASYARDIGSMQAAENKVIEDNLREKAEKEKTAPPKIFSVNENAAEESPKKASKNENESHMIMTKKCSLRKVTDIKEGVFKLYKTYITITIDGEKQRVIQLADLVYVLLRKVLQKLTAIEFFCGSGRTYFVDFDANPMPIIEALCQLQVNKWATVQNTADFADFFERSGFTNKWVRGEITNFDYIMALNIFGCRSFNDPSVYPLFPWTVSNFASEDPDFSPENFRDLNKPIGAIGERRLAELKDRIEEMKDFTNFTFLYSSYVVCPLSVYLWLLRLEPFTGQHVSLQGGKFDQAARIFSSVSDAFRMCTQFMNDYRELIPEFYFMPEFLVNSNHFDLGKVRGNKINDVSLPAWASTPFEFIYKMRRFLESDYVSENLNKWIDLIWGYKSTGVEAEKANNTYMPEIYEDIWKREKNPDSFRKAEIEANLSNVGQVPPKLFDKEHVHRSPITWKHDYQPANFSLANEPICGYITNEHNGIMQVSVSSKNAIETFTVSFCNDGIDIKQEKEIKTHLTDGYAVQIHPRKDLFFVTNSKDFYHGKDLILKGIDGLVAFSDTYYIVSYGSKVKVGGPQLSHTIPFYDEKVRCLAISKYFRTFVAGTESGMLYLCSVFDGTKTNAVALEKDGRRMKPVMSIITNSFGYIVTYANCTFDEQDVKRFILVHTINGELIRCVETPYEVAHWSTFASREGFDFVIFADRNGSLYKFDAFKVDIEKHTLVPDVCCLRYCVKHELCVVIVKSNGKGKIMFIPWEIK